MNPGIGLTSAEVAQRVAAGQRNDLPERGGRTTGQIIRANVFTRINAILTVLLVLVLTTGSLINAMFGLLIIANSIIGIIQELRAKATLDRLAVVGQAKPRVRRDGTIVEIAPNEVVQDDVIEVGAGDQIIVDGAVVAASHLEVDESLLTGESDPTPKNPGDPVMSGSFVVAGSGAYAATKVGREAYAARLVEEASKFTLVNSEIRNGINSILKLITWLLVPVGILTIWTQLTQTGAGFREAVLRMTGALVPMVPEGLVLLTSVAFAVGVIRLGKRNCLVNELPAIEGLARVDVVCADKTGTLTENGTTLDEIKVVGDLDEEGVRERLRQLGAADPSPNASMQSVLAATGEATSAWTATAVAPFTSAKKWSGASFTGEGSWVLGAPDVLAPAGSAVAEEAEQLGGTGLRVLLVGSSTVAVDDPAAPGEVSAVGLVCLRQIIRPDAKATLEYFASQEVTVKVISGDNAVSVGAVTRELGLAADIPPVDARTLPPPGPEFTSAIAEGTVFGRVTPEQKRAMVQALQERRHTVAMTGDGVNDVLALKDADIGVAMGAGSPATRSVAQIVLLDNKFATLPHVVAEGRRVIGNIERVANLFLTKTVYSVLLALLVGLWQLPFPFQPIHVTIVGWFTIGIPAFLLSLAPNNERARPGFVTRVIRLALPCGIIVGTVTFVVYRLVDPGPRAAASAITQSATAALVALILTSLWVLAVVARPYRWWKVALLVVCATAYILIFAWPWARGVLLLDVGDAAMMRTGLVAGLIGAFLVEVNWWVQGTILGERPHVWSRADD